MPRRKSFDEEEALNKAMDLFWKKGYESTSLADLTKELGLGKGSFYATFKSKENLFNQCIKKYTELNYPFLDESLATEPDFKLALNKLLESYIDGLMGDNSRKGCFMANSCSLVNGNNKSVEKMIANHYSEIGSYFQNYLIKHGVDKNKAESASVMIITFLIGASQQSKINRDKSGYLVTIRSILALLD